MAAKVAEADAGIHTLAMSIAVSLVVFFFPFLSLSPCVVGYVILFYFILLAFWGKYHLLTWIWVF